MKKKSNVFNESTPSTQNLFNCKICGKSGFTTSYKLKSHLFFHKAIAARFKCKYCDKEYYRTDEYKRHIASHGICGGKSKLFYCDHCERGFVDKRNLILHLNIHDDLYHFNDFRYKCNACGATYCEERLLKYHIRKQHLNLREYQPTYLNKELNDTWIEKVSDTKNCVQITKVSTNVLTIKKCKMECSNLKKENTNTALKEYLASEFATKNNYYSKAICDYCGKEMLKKSIGPHIRERHWKLRRFQCKECSLSFKRHYQLCLHTCGQVDGRKNRRINKQL